MCCAGRIIDHAIKSTNGKKGVLARKEHRKENGEIEHYSTKNPLKAKRRSGEASFGYICIEKLLFFKRDISTIVDVLFLTEKNDESQHNREDL